MQEQKGKRNKNVLSERKEREKEERDEEERKGRSRSPGVRQRAWGMGGKERGEEVEDKIEERIGKGRFRINNSKDSTSCDFSAEDTWQVMDAYSKRAKKFLWVAMNAADGLAL